MSKLSLIADEDRAEIAEASFRAGFEQGVCAEGGGLRQYWSKAMLAEEDNAWRCYEPTESAVEHHTPRREGDEWVCPRCGKRWAQDEEAPPCREVM